MTLVIHVVIFFVCLQNIVLYSDAIEVNLNSAKNVELNDLMTLLIPTSDKIANAKCRNHSLYYLENARKFTLWATEMFDATAKFPTGILVGSTYEMGSFDECVQARAFMGEEKFQGKYCLATLTIVHPENETHNFDDGNIYNISAWQRIESLSKDRSKRSRNEIHWGFCMPSSCTNEDLEAHLTDYGEFFNQMDMQDFKILSTVNDKSCQIENSFKLTVKDIVFIVLLWVVFSIVVTATLYDLLSRSSQRSNKKNRCFNHEISLSFSLMNNLEKILSSKAFDSGLDCINGLKVFSMFLIIMGHRIMFSVGSPLSNSDYVESFYSKIEAMVLLNGPIIVDTFFNISGFLACYLLLNEFNKRKKSVKFWHLYLHRIIRLTPPYAIMLAFYCTLLVKLGSGPLWEEKVGTEQERCLSSWWTNLVYINNYFYTDKICMFQSWYITCDMHLFIITPGLVWLLWKKPNLGIAAIILLTMISIISTFLVAYFKKLDAILLLYMKVLKDPIADSTFRNIYIPTHTRASPYFVGMFTGYLKHKIKQANYKFSKKIVYIAWILCIIVMEVTVYSAYIFYVPGLYDMNTSAIYAAFHHFLWSICISWFILALSTGNGTWIEPILAWRGLAPLSRITYAAFLCHGAIQLYSVATLRQPIYASIFNLAWFTLGDIALSFIAGLFLCLFFESPIISLEKALRIKQKDVDDVEDNHENKNKNNGLLSTSL